MATSLRITVVGAGYVGLVTATGLANLGHRVELVETRTDRLDALRAGIVPVFEDGLQVAFDAARDAGRVTIADSPTAEVDLVLICVGTPFAADGRSDLSQLRSALITLEMILETGVPLVVRSTLPPGGSRLVAEWTGLPTSRIFTNPEFLRQGTALADFLRPSRIVVGRFPDADPAALETLAGLFQGFEAPLLVVDVAAAELIKNGANAFLALKLSFTNEMASLAEEFGADVDDVLEGIAYDPRIGSGYMRPGLGFGGSCLPKELRALAVAGSSRGLAMHVTNAASDANAAQQLRFAGRVADLVGGAAGRRIALLGLAFKAGTDDVRDSPALAVAQALMAAGAEVHAYDPQATANALRELPGLETATDPIEAMTGADAVVIATEWPAFREIDWAAARRVLRTPLVVDGRRHLDAPAMRALGYRYEMVGTASRPATQAVGVTVS